MSVTPYQQMGIVYAQYINARITFERAIEKELIDESNRSADDYILSLHEEMTERAFACVLQQDACRKHNLHNKQEFTDQELINLINETKI
jgi:aspartokinase